MHFYDCKKWAPSKSSIQLTISAFQKFAIQTQVQMFFQLSKFKPLSLRTHFYILIYCNFSQFTFPLIINVGNLNIIIVFAMRRLSSNKASTGCEIRCTMHIHIDDKLICKCFPSLGLYIYKYVKKYVQDIMWEKKTIIRCVHCIGFPQKPKQRKYLH